MHCQYPSTSDTKIRSKIAYSTVFIPKFDEIEMYSRRTMLGCIGRGIQAQILPYELSTVSLTNDPRVRRQASAAAAALKLEGFRDRDALISCARAIGWESLSLSA